MTFWGHRHVKLLIYKKLQGKEKKKSSMQIANGHLNSLFPASAKLATSVGPAASPFGCVCVWAHERVRRLALTHVTDMGHPLTATEGVDTPLKATALKRNLQQKSTAQFKRRLSQEISLAAVVRFLFHSLCISLSSTSWRDCLNRKKKHNSETKNNLTDV